MFIDHTAFTNNFYIISIFFFKLNSGLNNENNNFQIMQYEDYKYIFRDDLTT